MEASEQNALAALPRARTPVPIEYKIQWAQIRSSRFRKEINLFPLPEFETQIFHPVA